MSLKEKIGWTGQLEIREASIHKERALIESGTAERVTYYFFVGSAVFYAIEVHTAGDAQKTRVACQLAVDAVLAYFYGDWRSTQNTPDGQTGHEAWKPYCLWYDEVQQSLPLAAALSDWEALKRIAEYPPENKLPEAAKAKGETAWGWALVMFLRGESRKRVEEFLAKAEADKANRPKLLAPVLRALLDNDGAQFKLTLLDYLAYYRKKEFKLHLSKLVSLEGTTLFHLGRRQGYKVELPEDVADHIIRFSEADASSQLRKDGEPSAPPNGGPTKSFGNSGVSGGPPSVS